MAVSTEQRVRRAAVRLFATRGFHGTGIRDLVPAMALAGVAAGADGIMVEVHRDPANALSDGAQSLDPAGFASMMSALRAVAAAVGRPLA